MNYAEIADMVKGKKVYTGKNELGEYIIIEKRDGFFLVHTAKKNGSFTVSEFYRNGNVKEWNIPQE